MFAGVANLPPHCLAVVKMSYRYEPLQSDSREFRILSLLPGGAKDPLRIRLYTTTLPLESWEAPPYEALSYVWGEQSDQDHATVAVAPEDGSDKPDTYIELTRNLATCLPYLRYRRQPRALWIDTICIDQENLNEKSQCVRAMAEIYNFASRVIIWLGPEANYSTNAIKQLEWLGSQVIINWKARSMILAAEPTLDELDEVIYRNLDIFLLLLSRPWFERLWVQQEAKLARHAVVVCSSASLDWQVFRNALFCLWHFSQRESLPGDVVDRMNRFYILITKTRFLLYELLFHGKTRKCTDPRDRVYALLGLIGGHEAKLNIVPDYTRTPTQVYQDVVASYLKNLRRIDPLACCELPEDGPPDENFPTWVPDWASPRKSAPFTFKRHPPTFDAQAKIIDERILCAMGVQLARIKTADARGLPSHASSQEIVDFIRALAPSHLWEGSPDKEDMINVFCRTMMADHFRERWKPPDGQETIESEARELIRAILDDSYSEEQHLKTIPTATRYLSLVRLYSVGRAFLTTDDGQFAIGPKTTQPGDVICMLLGCKSPLVLKTTVSDKASGEYNLAGECYLDSAVAGEAFLGPLPDYIKNVTSYNVEVDMFGDSFLNVTTNKIQREDPRLEAKMGVGYRSTFPDLEVCHEAENRTALEILAERGVELKEFKIV